jgi:CRP-like cAMP-binding protein
MSNVDLLHRTGWLAGRAPETRAALLAGGRLRQFDAGETVYRYDDPPDGMYALLSGSLSVAIPNDIGSEYTIYQASPGFWIGDLALFSDQKRLVSVTAVTEAKVFFVPQAHLAKLVRDRPALLRDFYVLTHDNMALQMQLLANLAIPNSEKRVAAFLLRMVAGLDPCIEWLDLPQERLAAMVAVSLPTVQRVLKRMADRDLVELGYGRLRVLDVQDLTRFAAE